MTEEKARRWADRLHAVLGIPATDGNEIMVLRNGNEIFPAMLEAIKSAEHTVDIVTFVYWSGEIAVKFADALSAAAARGCRVRVLLDAVGARKIDDALTDQMTQAGCDVRWFRPVIDGKVPEIGSVNHRTHRKILVCDATVAFTGGVGIADEWTGDARNEHEWRDTHVEIRGPVVASLQAGFIDNWADDVADGFDPSRESLVASDRAGSSPALVIRGSAQTGASEIWRLILTLIACAEHEIRIASAYFNPDDQLVNALRDAAARGVDVTILLPGEHADKRFVQIAGEASYEELLDAGVLIRTYEVSMMHAKVITVDGAVASVGSANFNQRSMQHDEESNLVVFDPDVVGVLDRQFDDDLESSIVLDPARWAERGLLQRVAEKISGTVSGLL